MAKIATDYVAKKRVGRLIAFEGIDGSGKTSVLNEVMLALESSSIKHTKLQMMPEGRIRELVLWDHTFTPAQRMLLYKIEADRTLQKVKDLLKEDQVVFLERGAASTIAYQGYGDVLLPEVITLNSLFEPFPTTDLTLWFDLPVSMAIDRLNTGRSKKDVFEQKTKSFFQRVSHGYAEIFRDAKNVLRLDATDPLDVVTKNAIDAVLRVYTNQSAIEQAPELDISLDK